MGYDQLKELDVEVLAMSVDSVHSHKVWNESELSKMVEGGIPFPMLSDRGGKIGSLYGVYDEKAGVDVRGRFLIDPDGIVQAAEILSPPVGRNPHELLRQIKAFQHTRSTGQVMPSGWEPDGPTLKPSMALAGRVWEVWQPPKVKS